MDEFTSLEGPVDTVDGHLTIMIPLAEGGCDFVACTRGIGEIDGEDLKIRIPEPLALHLGIREGSRVQVDNQHGKFNIRLLPSMAN